MKKIFIIAEAGVNHNGDIKLAKMLIKKAKESGADAVKFQTFRTKYVISKATKKAEYQGEGSQFDMIKKLELSFSDFEELKIYADKIGIMFLSTPFDFDSIRFLNKKLKLPIFKIPSGEITNFLYLKKIAETNKKIIMSTGMANDDEIAEAVKILRESGAKDISLLYCISNYPTPYEDVNLLAMRNLKKFGFPIGFSDHSLGIEVSIAAVALGASIIEKHFTLDKKSDGPDHEASLEPEELKKMVQSIRNVEKALGKEERVFSKAEMKIKEVARKSIRAKKTIRKGEIFTDENLAIKRPETGISPMKYYEVLGKKAKRDFKEDEQIEI
ncbi:MAG: N-acetylneuraminate synthase [Clostridiales Family XIII bacterium]|jgi:N,N'-diacetyllegionaminate synthase|nr:N-acetylneuraminate synthase [Clostridiales Family XIII bacterium]